MENSRRNKLILLDQYVGQIYYNNPHMFKIDDRIVKIVLNNRYYKGMQMNIDMRNAMFKKLSVAYIGYLTLLVDALDYENKVDLYYLKNFNVSKSMIDSFVRPKLIWIWAIKKYEWKHYLNPLFAYKGKVINKSLVDLFEQENARLYWLKL